MIKHLYHYDAYLQLKSSYNNHDVMGKNGIKNEGGIWSLERMEDENGERNLVKIKNKKTNRYLRIHGDGDKINAGGSGGKYTLFEITLISAQNHNLRGARLESAVFPGKFIVIRPNGNIGVTDSCSGDIDCVLIFMTTQRELELINLKNELKVIELQQEVENLKSELKLLREQVNEYQEDEMFFRDELDGIEIDDIDIVDHIRSYDIDNHDIDFSNFRFPTIVREDTPTIAPTIEDDDIPIPTYDSADRHRAADNYDYRRHEMSNGKEEEDDEDDDWYDDEEDEDDDEDYDDDDEDEEELYICDEI